MPRVTLARHSRPTLRSIQQKALTVTCALTLAYLVGGTDLVSAAEWSAEPSLGVKGVYNSNLLLTTLDHDETFGYWVSPSVKLAGTTEHLEVSGRIAADFVSYSGGQDANITNLYFPLTTRYRTERDVWGLAGGFTRDNTLMGELQQTGVVLNFTQRDLWTLHPSWTHAMTETVAMTADYEFRDATYENGARLGLVDHQIHTVSAGPSYDITERTRLLLTGVYVNFEAPDLSVRSQIVGPQLTATHAFTETLSGTIGGGPRFVSTTRSPQSGGGTTRDTIWVLTGRLERQYEDWSLRVEAGREIYPSGFGFLLQSDRLGTTITKQVTETVTASVSGDLYRAEAISTQQGPGFQFPRNRYVKVTPRVTWQVSDSWAVEVSYTYAQRDVASLSQTAKANSAYIMLTYLPPKLSLSR